MHGTNFQFFIHESILAFLANEEPDVITVQEEPQAIPCFPLETTDDTRTPTPAKRQSK